MPDDVDLRHHGDAEAVPGLLDLAVNVRPGGPPAWLHRLLVASLTDVGAYPDARAARSAVAGRHGRPEEEVLLTAGAAEAFVLLARVLQPRRTVCVHPSFTEPEAALRAAGHAVSRLLLAAPAYRLGAVPDAADLVVLGNPTNPTGVLHPAADVAALCRPGRTVVVDEAFADAVPGESESLAGRRDLPGLVVVRSLTKTWGLAGLRVGYLLADAATVTALADAQPLWPVSGPGLVAAEAVCAPDALAEADRRAVVLRVERDRLAASLGALPGVAVTEGECAAFVLVRVEGRADLRDRLRGRGIAVRRGDTFPGLGPDWFRVAVREPAASDRLITELTALLA